jgi:leucyl-tRNA synthetase
MTTETPAPKHDGPATGGTGRAEYDARAIEKKWQRYWDDRKLFEPGDDAAVSDGREPYYALAMFPYPSGAAHIGHVRNYTLIDAVARYQRAKGRAVINPIGWDAFGLPAENAAIRTGIHPKISTFQHIDRMRTQFKQVGFAFDWSREVFTCREDYYRWTQWLFLKMLGMKGKSGQPLAYRKASNVHWCPKDMTVLANEQVVTLTRDGKTYQGCFRCNTPVEQKLLEQWCFRITDYADELLDGLIELEGNWPSSVLAQVAFKVSLGGKDEDLAVFTTRADTLFGVTFLAIAPEHPLMGRIVAESKNAAEVRAFVDRIAALEAEDRQKTTVKEGVDTGIRARHPFTGEMVPVFVANYVLMYGTGAVMAVPAHDQRDFEFAQQKHLPIKRVIEPGTESGPDAETLNAALLNNEAAFTERGTLTASAEFSGLSSSAAITHIGAALAQKHLGGPTVNYRLRDWGLSRQRYWGCPIPVVHCPSCGMVPVPESQLPVRLPDDVAFMPTGKSPLDAHPAFAKTTCPKCSRADARRDTDTMDTFVDSSWYFLRYCDPNNTKHIADPALAKRWMPVDQYIGGSEHAILHLIYARFINRVLRDLGISPVGEPFRRLFTQGMIQKEAIRVKSEGYRFISADELETGRKQGKYPESDIVRELRKMSKSQLNVVDPEYIVDKYGADTLRAYVMFIGPADSDAVWDDSALAGVAKFMRRWWDAQQALLPAATGGLGPVTEGACTKASKGLRRLSHLYIEKTAHEYSEGFTFNTCIAKAMELLNYIREHEAALTATPADRFAAREALETMALCTAPIAPHICDELWNQLGHTGSCAEAAWPAFRPELTKLDEIEIAVQVNGKVRGTVTLSATASQDDVVAAARANPGVAKYLENVTVRKVIFVPGKICNIVAN